MNTMKKTGFAILLTALIAMVPTSSVLASTDVSFSPTSVSVKKGQTFTLTIGVNPKGVKNYTVKTELNYPSDLLEVKSFTFTSGWMAVAQPGYDLIDNASGSLIKTAGYPGGLSTQATFGTVSFVAKKDGNGSIVLSGDSLTLDANNNNLIGSGAVSTTVNVSTPAPVKAEPVVTKKVEKVDSVVEQETVVVDAEEEVATSTQSVGAQALVAAVGASAVTLGTGNMGIGMLVVILILVVVFYLGVGVGVRRSRRR
ncbi:hypothetical protein COB55_01140 [Candidatus Wolfebacteria bacterium]|nr:MAG: hypothetical protein COB55_01140 [Candidatus Wolfebacteria bacterium]